MDRAVLVYVDLDGVPHLTGRLWSRLRKNKESAMFEYDPGWLRHPARFALEPALALGPGAFHTAPDAPLFGAIGDSAPDRWGRALMRRMSRRQAEREGRAARTLREADYLLMVDDEARQGALRFAEQPGGPFLREPDATRIPPLIELPRLLSAAEHVVDEKDTDEDLRLLFAPGSSLGGARPKASVRLKDGSLAIAKFPRRDDEINVVAWEATALTLARKAGIATPVARLEDVAGKPVLVVTRFDRVKGRRVQDILVAVDILDEPSHAAGVREVFLFGQTLVDQLDLHAVIEKGKLAQAPSQNVEVIFDNAKRLGAGEKMNFGTLSLGLAGDL